MPKFNREVWIELRRRGPTLSVHLSEDLNDLIKGVDYPSICLVVGQGELPAGSASVLNPGKGHIQGDIMLRSAHLGRHKDLLIATGPAKVETIALPTDTFVGDDFPLASRGGNQLAAFYSKVIGPFVNAVCIYPSAFGTPAEFFDFMAEWLSHQSKQTQDISPRLILVLRTETDTERWIRSFHRGISERTKIPLQSAFSDLEVFVSPGPLEINQHKLLGSFLFSQTSMTDGERKRLHMRFSAQHLGALFKEAYTSFLQNSLFGYITAARTECPIPAGATNCIKTFLRDFKQGETLESFALPVLASCIILNAYPPGMHLFETRRVYELLYEPLYQNLAKALQLPAQASQTLSDLVHRTWSQEEVHNNLARHKAALRSFAKAWGQYRTNDSCLFCLMRRPQYRLPCGHTFCEESIRQFGCKANESTWLIDTCPLCQQDAEGIRFKLKPPTKGVSMLTIDGGGVRGIIPLQNLYMLEQKLKPFLPHFPIQNHFDLAIGTSSGGLIVLATMFQGIPISRCIELFRSLSTSIFRGRFPGLTSSLSSFAKLLVSVVADSVYPARDIERALKEQFGTDAALLDCNAAAARAAKVAVVVQGTFTGGAIMTNYNGTGARRSQQGYKQILSKEPEEIKIWEAARATSAAPWYFTPCNIAGHGPFEDGGLFCTNPELLGRLETQSIWPHVAEPDLILSLGTGRSLDTKETSSPQSPLTPIDGSGRADENLHIKQKAGRFVQRLFRSFLGSISMDGEKFHQLSAHPTQRVDGTKNSFRLNLDVMGSPPSLDDVSAMEELRLQTQKQHTDDPVTTDIVNSLIATLFYFELTQRPRKCRKGVECVGRIICDLEPGSILSHFIGVLAQKGYSFTCSNNVWPVLLQNDLLQKVYEVPLKIMLDNKYSPFSIRLQCVDATSSRGTGISASPFRVEDLMRLQGWSSPFGREDYGDTDPATQICRKRKKTYGLMPSNVLRRRIDY